MRSPHLVSSFLALLQLAGLITVHGNAAASGAVMVATADDLAAAVADVAEHIVITAHLDLTSLPVFDYASGVPTSVTEDGRTLFINPARLQSLRVRFTSWRAVLRSQLRCERLQGCCAGSASKLQVFRRKGQNTRTLGRAGRVLPPACQCACCTGASPYKD